MSQPRDRIIEAGSVDSCFLCSFLKETTNATSPLMTWDRWSSDVTEKGSMPIPEWALALVNQQAARQMNSHEPPFTDGYYSQPISCGQMQDRYIQLFGRTEPTKEQNHATQETKLETAP